MAVSQTNPDVKSLPAQVFRSSEKIWLPVWRDRAGTAIKNSANLLPIMPIYEPVSIAVYRIVKFKTYSDAEFKSEIDALNSTTWKSFTQWQAWISEIHSGGTETLGDSDGEKITYIIRCIDRTDGWKAIYPDVGYVYRNSGSVKSFASTTGNGYIGNLTSGGDDGSTTMLIKSALTKKTVDFSTITGL